MTWKAIHTAPRKPLDQYGYGPALLVWTPDRICVAQWDRDFERWYLDQSYKHDPQPTHWKPLPKPPKGWKND